MISSWHLMLALTVTLFAAVLAVLAVRRRARRLDAAQHKTDLHAWESEGGSPVRRPGAQPPS